MKPDMGRRQARVGDPGDHVEGRQDTRPGIAEVEHHAVAEPLDRLAAVLDRGSLDEPGQRAGQLGRGVVAALLGQPGVPGDVEEADGGRPFEAVMEALFGEHDLEAIDQVGRPDARLLGVVHRKDGCLGEGGDSGRQLRVGDRLGALPRGHRRGDHLALPPGAFLLGDPPGAVSPSTRSRRSMATGRKPSSSWASMKRTVGSSSSRSRSSGDGCGQAGRLADDREQLERDAGPGAGLGERLIREGGEPLVGWRVQEVEGDRARAIAVATPSSGMPPSSSDLTIAARRTSPDDQRSGLAGWMIPSPARRSKKSWSTPARRAASVLVNVAIGTAYGNDLAVGDGRNEPRGFSRGQAGRPASASGQCGREQAQAERGQDGGGPADDDQHDADRGCADDHRERGRRGAPRVAGLEQQQRSDHDREGQAAGSILGQALKGGFFTPEGNPGLLERGARGAP